MIREKSTYLLAKWLSLVISGVILLLPIHAFFTAWLGSNFGHYDIWRAWKEFILLAFIPPIIWLVLVNKDLKKQFFSNKLIKLILAYILLTILLGIWALSKDQVTRSALVYGLIVNLRFFWIFIVCLVLSYYSDILKKYWLHLTIGPAVLVVGYGILQRFILPVNFLAHFGYGSKTLQAYQTVDSNFHYIRLQSLLRGPNPLGAYLILPLTVAVSKIRQSNLWQIFLALSLVTIFYTYSRSAWLGLVASLLGFVVISSRHHFTRRNITIVSLIAVFGLGGAFTFRSNTTFQDTILHTSKNSTTKSSNSVRLDALKNGWNDIVSGPLGRGPGTAGPASTRNNNQVRIAENYYLQIGQEVGLVGMFMFISIIVLTLGMLWRQKSDHLSLVLLCSLIGISVVNMLVHAWTDDTLSLIWWALAGVAVSPAIIKGKGLENAKNKK